MTSARVAASQAARPPKGARMLRGTVSTVSPLTVQIAGGGAAAGIAVPGVTYTVGLAVVVFWQEPGVGPVFPVTSIPNNGRGDTAWTPLPMQNGYTAGNSGDGTIAPASFRKDGQGFVHLRGWVNTPASAVQYDSIGLLPAGYRPAMQEFYAVTKSDAYGSLMVVPAGGILWRTGTPSAWISLSGVTFLAEN